LAYELLNVSTDRWSPDEFANYIGEDFDTLYSNALLQLPKSFLFELLFWLSAIYCGQEIKKIFHRMLNHLIHFKFVHVFKSIGYFIYLDTTISLQLYPGVTVDVDPPVK
jgi:hypothetical protein